jgi:hypothetical protein
MTTKWQSTDMFRQRTVGFWARSRGAVGSLGNNSANSTSLLSPLRDRLG